MFSFFQGDAVTIEKEEKNVMPLSTKIFYFAFLYPTYSAVMKFTVSCESRQ